MKKIQLEMQDPQKQRKFATRAFSTFWMLSGFILILCMGHVYIWAMIIVIQILMARELFNLVAPTKNEKRLLGSKFLNWYYVLTAMWIVYGYLLRKHFASTIMSYDNVPIIFKQLFKYHALTCFLLYIGGLAWFTLTLKGERNLHQYGQFAWTHMILIFMLMQSAFSAANVIEGIIWFLLPASLVVINDVAAYICGYFIGRTPLTKLSPKKTWEGFVGALIITIPSAYLLADWMGRSPWLTCPRHDFSKDPISCDLNPLFQSAIHWHALAYGLAASVAAPVWGFFVSGIKRAFKIKDFGDIIPGHGGITDRMDCQIIMAFFSYIYYQSFIAPPRAVVKDILDQTLMTLALEQQQELYMGLGKALASGLPRF